MTSDEQDITRRDFLERAGAAGLGVAFAGRLTAPSARPSRSANEKVVVAVVGLNSRGLVHAQNFARLPNSEVAYLCDVDSAVLGKAATATTQTRTPKLI